jgi:hypothetical protein
VSEGNTIRTIDPVGGLMSAGGCIADVSMLEDGFERLWQARTT